MEESKFNEIVVINVKCVLTAANVVLGLCNRVCGVQGIKMDVLNDVVSAEDLQKFESLFNEQLRNKNLTKETRFHYAWCLVRSKYPADIQKGILLLEELCQERGGEIRDYLYYLAVGNARLKQYSQALGYCRRFLEIEPMNQQVQELETLIKKNMDKEGVIGMAITAGFMMAVAAAVGIGVALSKRGH